MEAQGRWENVGKSSTTTGRRIYHPLMMKIDHDLSTVVKRLCSLSFFLVGVRVLPRDDSEEGDHMSGTELQKKCDA